MYGKLVAPLLVAPHPKLVTTTLSLAQSALENVVAPSHGRLSATLPPGVSQLGVCPLVNPPSACTTGATSAAAPGQGYVSMKVTLLPSGMAEWQPMHSTAPPFFSAAVPSR